MSKNKKVLFTATVDSHILLFHLPYLKYFKEKGYEVHVATNSDDAIPFCDKKIKISFERSPYNFNNFKAIFALKKEILKNKYDIIHTHTPMGSVVTRLAAKKARKKLGTKVIYTAHGFHFYKGASKLNWMLFYPVEKYLSKYTDRLITINQEDYELASNKFKKTKVSYVPGVGINEEKFNKKLNANEKLKLRKSLGLNKEDFILIYTAELSKRKNQEMLLKAISTIINDNNSIHLLLPGTDSMNGFHENLAKELNIHNNVHFLGFRTDIGDLLQISDLAVSTSNQEGLPVNIMEAMYLNVPILATDCRGNRDLVSDNKNGYLVEVGNEEAFKEKFKKIYKLCQNKEKLKNIRDKSRQLIEPYMLDKVMVEMDKIYTDISNKKVLHLLASNIYSGAENVACNIINSSEHKCYYCSPDGPIKKMLDKKNIQFIPIKKMRPKYLKQIIKKYDIDIVHGHDYKASILAAFTFKGKIISHLHCNAPFAKKWNLKSFLYTLSMSKYYKIIGVSKEVYKEAIFKKKMKKKFKTIYNYVPSEDIINKADQENIKKQYDLFYVGRLVDAKNPLKFIEVVESLKKDIPNIKAVMIGDGELFDVCCNKIKEEALEKNIEMVGFKENPFPIIKNSKIGIMPSKWEGFGLTAIESMILNKPVLNSGSGGLKEIFKKNKEFICCDNYYEKVKKILMNKDYYKNLEEETKEIVLKFTDSKKWKEDIKKIYE